VRAARACDVKEGGGQCVVLYYIASFLSACHRRRRAVPAARLYDDDYERFLDFGVTVAIVTEIVIDRFLLPARPVGGLPIVFNAAKVHLIS